MQRLNELESSEKKVRNITLKTSTKRNDELEDEVVESSDNENLNLLVKRFGKFLKRRGNKGKSRRYNSKQAEEPEDEVAESSESENLNLLVKRFAKYLKRKGIKGNPKRYSSKHNESNSSNFTCYNCGK